ncbi:hypothetical protein IGI04_040165 [Brassica rapa subsp. trilocularis]|uniref:Uncharacterized protein n=1 Tax=Brassica rapa subsp. trilocularis TaxID=1813537 RepID=A0ABQ7KQL0_BRACM|nr:hypothetical protein IGI04_040165 [Brassica rapa subsp. trilocularis]
MKGAEEELMRRTLNCSCLHSGLHHPISSSHKVFLILDVLSSLFKTKPVHVPSETARNPDQLAFAKQTARVRGLSVHLGGPVSSSVHLGGPVSTICKTKVILILKT